MPILKRTGQAPLSVDGELIACSNGQRLGGKDHARYHDISLYELESGKYVLHIAYQTNWQGELPHYFTEVFDTAEKVVDCLRNFNPMQHVTGFPPSADYAERQQRLMKDVKLRWDTQVSEVLDNFVEECK